MSLNQSVSSPVTPLGPATVLARELTCPICLQLFCDPVSLPCGHIYCSVCIHTMGEGLDQHTCPECHLEYQVNRDVVKSSKMSRIVESCMVTGGQSTIFQPSLAEPQQDDGRCATTGNLFTLDSQPAERKITRLDKPKFDLASQITELTLKLAVAEGLLKTETEREMEVKRVNSLQRDKLSSIVMKINDMSQNYCSRVMKIVEEELFPSEELMSGRVAKASEMTKQLRRAMLRSESLLTEDDEAAFTEELQTLQPHVDELMALPEREEKEELDCKVDSSVLCSKLDQMNSELWKGLMAIHQSLRNAVNPSEVNFDPETAHPNLILTDDLKTVTFSAAKQPYPSSPKRFANFFQVLSRQSFQEGTHSWRVEMEGAPWIIGLVYSENFARSGVASALESNPNSWCLMWFNHLLTAYEKGKASPLKKTTLSRHLEIQLCFDTNRLSFYNISTFNEKTHIHTFTAEFTQPVHVAYRMLSGHPKGRVVIYS